ncbi:MAG TPA: CPBP family intramembrane glutamic endopeptidase [Terriglobales bacterium]|nr:CPBP family intramembrane glutamic endopeptidase [Terriglobales bacterium]
MAPGGPGVRLQGRDWRLIAMAVAVAAASLWVVSRYFHRAFPEASIDFQVSGAGSEPIALNFLHRMGLSPAGDLHAEQFGYDDSAKTFLERELGLERTGALLRQRIPLWQWQHRWFRPLTKEEYRVSVSTAGPVVGFDHEIASDAPGASLSEEQARARAEQFLTQVMHRDWQSWVGVGAEREVRPHRVDYLFTWKEAAPLEAGAGGALAQAEYRHVVRVQGGQIGLYQEYLKVPEQWQRDFAALRSQNQDAGEVDTGLLLVLAVGMVFVLVMRIRRADIRWRPALWVGLAGAVLSFLAALNAMGASLFGYDTTKSFPAFVAGNLLGAAESAVGVGVLLLILTAAAEALYRERFGAQVSVASYLSWRGVRSKSFLISVVLGLALAAFFFAYQTIFYLIANHFGAWAPADVPYDDLLNTKLPWAFVLFSGFFPAISEEFGFRMLAIPLFEKWFRSLWVAVIAASFLWGFGHATYPNEPFYIRGVEVGLGGILLSWIMIRFGILTTVVWHYTVDALYTALLLLRAHDAYLRWSGATTALLAVAPLLVAAVAYLAKGGFVEEGPLTNAAAGTAPPLPPAAPAAAGPELPAYVPVSGPNWTAGLIVAAALLSAFAVPLMHWDWALPWRTSPQQAIAAARGFLQRQGYDVSGYRTAALVASPLAAGGHGAENQVAAADIFARRGERALVAAFSGPPPTVAGEYWQVRFFRELQKEEFDVAVRADSGQVIAFAHPMLDSAPGGAPTLAAAQATAERFLAAQGMAVAGMTVRTALQQRRAARTDSTFVWEAAAGQKPAPLPGAVAYRVEAELAGGAVASFGAWYHVPEARLRAYRQSTLLGVVLGLLKGLLYAASAALIFGLLFGFARRRSLAWSKLLKIAAAGGVLMLGLGANSVPTALAGYPTAIPWSGYVLSVGISLAVAGLLGFLATLALLAPLAITAPLATALTVANARRQLERETAWDALWVGVLGLAWMLGWQRVQVVVNARWHRAGLAALPTPPAGLVQWLPGLSDALGAPLHAFWTAAGLGILLPVLWHAWRNPKQRPLCYAGIGLLWIGSFPAVHSPAQFAMAGIFSALSLVLLFGFAHLFLRESPLAYFSAALMPALVAPAAEWMLLPMPQAKIIGAALLGLAGAWLAWLAWVARGGSARV